MSKQVKRCCSNCKAHWVEKRPNGKAFCNAENCLVMRRSIDKENACENFTPIAEAGEQLKMDI